MGKEWSMILAEHVHFQGLPHEIILGVQTLGTCGVDGSGQATLSSRSVANEPMIKSAFSICLENSVLSAQPLCKLATRNLVTVCGFLTALTSSES